MGNQQHVARSVAATSLSTSVVNLEVSSRLGDCPPSTIKMEYLPASVQRALEGGIDPYTQRRLETYTHVYLAVVVVSRSPTCWISDQLLMLFLSLLNSLLSISSLPRLSRLMGYSCGLGCNATAHGVGLATSYIRLDASVTTLCNCDAAAPPRSHPPTLPRLRQRVSTSFHLTCNYMDLSRQAIAFLVSYATQTVLLPLEIFTAAFVLLCLVSGLSSSSSFVCYSVGLQLY